MSILMKPVLPVPGKDISLKTAGGSVEGVGSFAKYLDRHLDKKYGASSDKLGVNPAKESENKTSTQNNSKNELTQSEDTTDTTSGTQVVESESNAGGVTAGKNEANDENVELNSAADVLSQFIIELKEVAEQYVGVPGQWKVTSPDVEVLQQLAVNAGMDEVEFSQFMQQLGKENNQIELGNFFQSLTEHFEEMQKAAAVTVSEAQMPMLESLLQKMGVPEETVSQIFEKAVSEDGKIDLDIFIKELASTVNENATFPVDLTDIEAEQLQGILAEAGLTLEVQNQLLPERFLNQILGQESAGDPVRLTVARLESILNETVSAVRSSRPEVDLQSFLQNLQKVVSQADFETQGVGWTPVVEKTVEEVFRNLQELVDLAQVQVKAQTAPKNAQQTSSELFDTEQGIDEQPFGRDYTELTDDYGKSFGESAEQEDRPEFSDGMATDQTLDETDGISARTSAGSMSTAYGGRSSQQEMASMSNVAKNTLTSANTNRFQQDVVQQLSDGVVRGLKNQEHHLVLRLFPQDMGEVRVSLTVRDEHVSVAFNMENSRVKEMLESNMEDFKDSMNQRGFNLGECSVSVGQQSTGNAWQEFEMARQMVKATGENREDLAVNALYLQTESTRIVGRQNGINLVV